ncbi:hypothetical protein TNCV_652341 [Trichonephila clavipes]|nr:hypothetical protein TNCV_652341 [Trichonephila clavipes]
MMDIEILNHGKLTKMISELVLSLQTTASHHRQTLSLEELNVKQPLYTVSLFSGTRSNSRHVGHESGPSSLDFRGQK